tara:strand:- start:97 stop:3705 length:3609 start_codon:yes stop_codon:yes gene_type:complete
VAFNPDEYLKVEGDNKGFNPDEYLSTSTPEFDPDAYLTEDSSSPGVGQIAAGVGTEIVAGMGGQLAGTAIGTAILPGIGTAVGYAAGSLSSGILGSIAAQKIEGSDDISWGRAIAAGLINLVPGGVGKAVKGSMTIGKIATREAAKGALFGATEATSRAIIDEGRLPTAGEMATYGGVGAIFGGALGTAATKIGMKFAGKTPHQIDADIISGKITTEDINTIVNAGKPTQHVLSDAEKVVNSEVSKSREAAISREAASALSEPIGQKNTSLMRRLIAHVAPSRITGRLTQEEAILYKNRISAAESEASRIARSVDGFIELNPNLKPRVDEFLAGGDMAPELNKIAPQLNRYRETLEPLQKELAAQLEAGSMSHITGEGRAELKRSVAQSIKQKNYVTRQYEIFTNKNFKQNPKLRAEAELELRNYYIAQGRTVETASVDAKKHIDHLVRYSARNMADMPNGSRPAALEGILRKRKDPGVAERAFLGEITASGERMRGTLTNTSRLVARNAADANIAKTLEDVGLASRTQREGQETLDLRSRDSTDLFVNPEVQIAINKLYANGLVDKSGDLVEDAAKDLLTSGIGLSKAVKVLFNLPSYSVQLWGNAAGLAQQGINPFNPARASRGLRLALSDFGSIEDLTRNPKARKALLDELKEMELFGLKTGNIIESDLRSTLESGVFSGALGKVVKPFGKLYSSLDVMGRYVGWKANTKTVMKLFDGMDEHDAKRIAALMINDTYQNYDKLSNTVRWATKWGVMPQFAAFTAEFMRNQYNQGRMIKQMLSGTFGADMGINMSKANLGAMRMEGASRLASTVAVYGAAYGVTEGIKSQFGVTPDKESALRETVLPDFDKNKSLAISLSKDGTGGSYANMSYILPQSVGIAALKAGLDGSDSTSLSALLVDELVGEGTFIHKEAMRALDNRNQRGKKISYSEDAFTSFKERLDYFITQSFKPGSAREIDKAMMAHRGVGDFTMKEIAARQVGYRVNKFDIAEQAMFNIRSTNDNAVLAKSEYNTAKKFRNLSPQALESVYQNSNAAFLASQQQNIRHAANLKTLNLSEGDVIQVLRESGMGVIDVLGALNGTTRDIPRLVRSTPSDIWAEEVFKLSDRDRVKYITAVSKTDMPLAQALSSKNKSDMKDRYRGVSAIDSLIRGLGISDGARAYYIFNESKKSENPDGYIKAMVKKGIVTGQVWLQIEKLKG